MANGLRGLATLGTLRNKQNLKRPLELWRNNEIDELIDECKIIQQRISQTKSSVANNKSVSKRFENYMEM